MRNQSQHPSPAERLARMLDDEQLRAVMAEVLNIRFALAADFIGPTSFADLLHVRLGDLTAPPAIHPHTGQNHSTTARSMVRDVSPAHLQDALAHLIDLHAVSDRKQQRQEFFVRYALLQIDHFVELATRVGEEADRYGRPIDILDAAAALTRKRERVAA